MSPLAWKNWNVEKSSFCNFFILKVAHYMWKRRTFVRRFLCCIFHQHILERATRLELASRHPTNCVPQFAGTLPHLWLKCASRMGVGIEFFPSNEKNQGIQIGCPDLLCLVLTEKMQYHLLPARNRMFAGKNSVGFSLLFGINTYIKWFKYGCSSIWAKLIIHIWYDRSELPRTDII